MKYQTYERNPFNTVTKDVIRQVIGEAYENGLEVTKDGKVADYIPELAKSNRDSFGICAWAKDGECLTFGDTTTRFTIQSISKVINLAVALKFRGARDVFSHVNAEPTGDAFNSIIKLDTASDLPFNPMINAGAIEVVSLLVKEFTFDELLETAREFCMDPEISLNEAVYRSESETGDRNRAIAWLLKSKGVLQADPDETLDLYFKMCSLNVTAKSMAGLGLVLSCDGMDPFREKHLIRPGYVRRIKSVMFTCGMYDYSGEYGMKVGIPSKSGVGGGIMCAAKGPMGIGTYGPSLDVKGNSIAGITALEHISHLLHLHALDFRW